MTCQEELEKLRAEQRRRLLERADRQIEENERLLRESERRTAARRERFRRAGLII